MPRIDGKTVWITGASSGIGEALTYALDAKGCKLIISSRRKEELKRVKSHCKNQESVKILPLDLADYDAMEGKVAHALSEFECIDILINNAGLSQRSLIVDTPVSIDKKLIDINYLGTVALAKALLSHFLERGKGHYVTVSSLMGKFGSPYRSGYSGAKHALHGFFDVLRMEHEKDGIDVTMICPGFVSTDVAKNALTADGSAQNSNDPGTENGLRADLFVRKMIRAIERKKFEAYIGGKEIMGVYLKRLSNRLLHKVILRSRVR